MWFAFSLFTVVSALFNQTFFIYIIWKLFMSGVFDICEYKKFPAIMGIPCFFAPIVNYIIPVTFLFIKSKSRMKPIVSLYIVYSMFCYGWFVNILSWENCKFTKEMRDLVIGQLLGFFLIVLVFSPIAYWTIKKDFGGAYDKLLAHLRDTDTAIPVKKIVKRVRHKSCGNIKYLLLLIQMGMSQGGLMNMS